MVTLLLVCAILMSLALGVLAGYAACFGLFRVFRWHATAAAQERVAAAAARMVVEG